MTLERDASDFIARARARLDRADLGPRLRQIGRVEEVGDGVAHVSGLPETRLDELLRFEDGTLGLAMRIGERELGCILLSEGAGIRAGGTVEGTGEIARVPVGPGLLGRVVSPIGAPLDGGPPIVAERTDPVERPAPGHRRPRPRDRAAADRASP
jgi:F-type H+-transporting ATPase subunit alpha